MEFFCPFCNSNLDEPSYVNKYTYITHCSKCKTTLETNENYILQDIWVGIKNTSINFNFIDNILEIFIYERNGEYYDKIIIPFSKIKSWGLKDIFNKAINVMVFS